MKVPQLTRKLILEAPIDTPDGSGGQLRGWQERGQVWAQVVGRSGRDVSEGDVTVSRARYRITVRAAPYGSVQRPTASCRFREGGRIFAIRAVVEQGSSQYLTCFADEEVAA